MCGGADLDRLGKETEYLDGAVRTITLESGERIHLLGHSLNKTQGQLKMISHNSNDNFHKIRNVLGELINNTDIGVTHWGACYNNRQSSAVVAAQFNVEMTNFTQTMLALRAELAAFKVGLHNFGYILDDALSSLARGYIPATLVPPKVLRQVLNGLKLDRMQEAIPRSDLMTYYGFELVESTVLTETAVNVLINVPVHHTNGFHKVYREVPVPQPIEDGSTATRYSFSRSYLLISERKDNFAEVTEEKLISHCSGSNRLKLCLKPFSMSRSGESTCLSSLFFDLQTSVLKLCAQQVVALPEEPYAEYLDDSTYLVYSRSSDYRLINYSSQAFDTGEWISGCKSCLIRPPCKGRIEDPSGSLVLYPDPRTCQYETGLVVRIQQHPLLRTLFGELHEMETQLAGMKIPDVFREEAHSQMLETLRLNLVDLPEGTVDEEAMKIIAKPFAQGIINQHAPFHWRAYHSGPVSWFVWFVLAAILVIALWMMYTGLCRVIMNKACIEGNTAGTQTSPRARRSRFNCWERLLRGDAGSSGQGPMNFRMTDRIQVPPYSERDGMESTQLEDDFDDSFISTPHHPPDPVAKRRGAGTTERSWRASRFYKL